MAAWCVLPFLGWWAYGLFDLDEGFYAAVVSDMLRRGDWVTPTYNGVPWFEKPILAYWLAMPSVAMLGEAWGPRLPSVLSTLGTAYALGRFAARIRPEAGWLVPTVYCGCLLPVGLGRMMMTDAPMVLALTLGLLAFWRSCEAPPGRRAWLRAAAGALVGCAVLAKGPVGLVLAGLVVGFSAWRIPAVRAGIRGGWWWAAGAFVLVVSLWYVPCYLVNGQEFVQKFLIEQNVGRFAGGDRAHAVPWWSHPFYYPAALALGMLPYWPWAGKSVWRPARPEEQFFAVWVLAVVGFFTLSGSKLPHYVLPAAPPAAVLVGLALAGREGGGRRVWVWAAAWSVALCVLANLAGQAVWRSQTQEVQALARHASGLDGGLVVYRIGREGGPGTGRLELQDTSHPSVLFYYGRTATMSDDPASLEAQPLPFAVLTREGRWAPPEGWDASPAGVKQDRYRLYWVRSR